MSFLLIDLLSCVLSVLGLTLESSPLLPYLAMTEQSGHMDFAQLCLNKARCMANMIRLCFLCEQQEVTNQCLKQMFNMIHSIHATLISAPSSETSTPALASAPKNTTYHISGVSGSDLSNPAAFWELDHCGGFLFQCSMVCGHNIFSKTSCLVVFLHSNSVETYRFDHFTDELMKTLITHSKCQILLSTC